MVWVHPPAHEGFLYGNEGVDVGDRLQVRNRPPGPEGYIITPRNFGPPRVHTQAEHCSSEEARYKSFLPPWRKTAMITGYQCVVKQGA
jgi:hypothetical protein